ncbi:MAG: phosphoribosyl-ATP diphosphatase, partial [Alphaproteobacteria bacterium]
MAKATKPGKAKPAKAKPAEKAKKMPGIKKKIAKQKALPLPGGLKLKGAKLPKRIRKVEARVLEPLSVSPTGADAMILDRLWETVEQRRMRCGDVARKP